MVVALACSRAASGAAESHLHVDQSSESSLWHELAHAGDPVAQYRLGDRDEYGRGVEASDARALEWYARAAAQGMATAQYRLGVLHDNGWGVREDDTEAVRWYRAAAQQGHALAQHDLAFMYAAGEGVERDDVKAYIWLYIAVAEGHTLMLKHLRGVSARLDASEIEIAQAMARERMAARHSQTPVE